ncbi:MAG: 3-hydroxyacyl-CoA dehydrogenase family protein [Oscillospiraceae bacterium]|nr:3-hydroxyacyl-CoA dehydrogenase family protein [Oscillospiraceae bacterium]
MNIQKVLVAGCGTMGSQIAMQAARYGYSVQVYDLSQQAREKAEQYAHSWFNRQVSKGRMTWEEAQAAVARLTFTGDLAQAAAGADLVIEAVPDVAKIKRAVLSQIDQYVPEHALYGSNSSYLVSSIFADSVRHPDRVANLHFFNPVLVMELVEVVQGPHTSKETVEQLMEFARSIGKTPVLVQKEIYGFVVNRIFSAITKEACYLLDQQVASLEDIDMAVKKGLGHPMGPFELLDMTGIDLEYNVLMEKFRTTMDPADRPAAALVERYAQGAYGRKTGRGFYTYGEQGETKNG